VFTPLRVLILEDRASETERLLSELRRVGFLVAWYTVSNADDYVRMLSYQIDVILASDSITTMEWTHALRLLHLYNHDIPVILIAESAAEEHAIGGIQHGADDYVLRDRMQRLGPAVVRAVRERNRREAERQRAARVLQQRTLRLEVLAEASLLLGSAPPAYQSTCDTVARMLAEGLGDGCTIRLVPQEWQLLNLVAFHHADPDIATLLAEFFQVAHDSADAGLHQQVMQTGRPVLLPIIEPEQFETLLSAEAQRYAEWIGVYSMIVVPLVVQGQVIGTISMSRNQPGRPYTPDEQDSLHDLADHLALLLAHAQLYQQVQHEHAARQQAEHLLRDMQIDMDQRVVERTAQLIATNEYLRREVSEHSRAEAALRESEERYRRLIDAANDMIVRSTPDGMILSMSSACLPLLGYEPHEIIGQSGAQFVPPDEQPRLAEWLSANPEIDEPLIMRAIRKDGSMVWLETTRRFIYDPQSGMPQEVVTISRDISSRIAFHAEIQRLNASLRQRTRDLEATNQELEAFSYSVSHDLRAPLRAIEGFARLLHEAEGERFGEEAANYLHRIQDNAQRMQRLIQDMLTFARVARQPLSRQVVEPVELVQRTYADLQAEYTERQIQLVVGDLPPCEADPALLAQVCHNLLSNALKFTRTREVALIEVGFRQEGEKVIYFVRDNGVGFDMRYAAKLFTAFQRLHSEEEYEGSGVGLSIVRRIITRHGGRVWIDAAPGNGATVSFTLHDGEE
jgi:PAS domain S-box-containing protein